MEVPIPLDAGPGPQAPALVARPSGDTGSGCSSLGGSARTCGPRGQGRGGCLSPWPPSSASGGVGVYTRAPAVYHCGEGLITEGQVHRFHPGGTLISDMWVARGGPGARPLGRADSGWRPVLQVQVPSWLQGCRGTPRLWAGERRRHRDPRPGPRGPLCTPGPGPREIPCAWSPFAGASRWFSPILARPSWEAAFLGRPAAPAVGLTPAARVAEGWCPGTSGASTATWSCCFCSCAHGRRGWGGPRCPESQGTQGGLGSALPLLLPDLRPAQAPLPARC